MQQVSKLYLKLLCDRMVGRCQRGVGFPLVRWQLQCKGAFRTSLDIRECVSVNHVSLRHPSYLFTRLLLGKSAVRNISLWTILLVPSSKSCCTQLTQMLNITWVSRHYGCFIVFIRKPPLSRCIHVFTIRLNDQLR